MKIQEILENKKIQNAIWIAVITTVIASTGKIIVGLYNHNSPSSEQKIEFKNNQNSSIARDIQTQNNYYNFKDSGSLVKKNLKSNEQPTNKLEHDEFNKKDLRNNEEKVEISIQLKSDVNGFNSIKVDGKDAFILPSSTPTNPRISVISNSNKLQTIMIITKRGDTCILRRVFDKKNSNNFPIRLIPDCKTSNP